MNNLRLLTGLLLTTLSSGGMCVYGQSIITLEEIFRTAETNSAQLQPSNTAIEEAAIEESIARQGRLPDINTSLSVSYIGDGFTVKRDFSDYQKAPIPHLGTGLAVGITQPVYTGGAISGAVELAEAKSAAARYAADLQQDNIRLQLTGFYLDLYKYTNLRRVIESNISAAEKVLEYMRSRHSQGTALQNDITRYELMVSDLGLQLVRINNMLDILNDNLVTVAGLPEGTVIVPDSTMLGRSLPLKDERLWLSEAEENSPSLGMARSGVEASLKAEKIARSGRLPKIGLQAGWNIDGPILVEIPPIDRNLSYWYVGIGVSWDISSLYKSSRTIARSRAAGRKASEELEAARQNISLAVREDYIHYLEAYEQLKTRLKSVELAERNYNTVAGRYKSDMALLTDMLDAANAKLDAEEQLANARIDIIYHYYKLLFITGRI